MDKIEKFKLCKPTTEEQKYITELMNLFGEVASAFIALHQSTLDHNKLFLVLKESCLGFAGTYLRWLCKAIVDKKQKLHFLEVSKKIFNAYMQEMLEDIKKDEKL